MKKSRILYVLLAGLATGGLLIPAGQAQLATPKPPPKAAEQPFNDTCPGVQGRVLRPVPESRTLPDYPPQAVQKFDTGITSLRVHVGQDGAPTEVGVLETSGVEILDKAAVDHISKNWKWAALPDSCRNRMISTRIDIEWNLRNSPMGLEGLWPQAMLGKSLVAIAMDPANYPDAALQRKHEGIVMVAAFLSDQGKVTKAEVLRTTGHRSLDDHAIEYAKSRRWETPRLDGKPIGSVIVLAMAYSLPGKPALTSSDLQTFMNMLSMLSTSASEHKAEAKE